MTFKGQSTVDLEYLENLEVEGMTQPTKFYCRSHLDHQVTWKGTGCRGCRTERVFRLTSKQEKNNNEMEMYQ
jgi:hypothetical protein